MFDSSDVRFSTRPQRKGKMPRVETLICLSGKLVDITKNYKYMYFCCGGVVILASIWLFIGNFINYRLLDRERRQADTYKRTEVEDPDRVQDGKEADVAAQASEEPVDKSPKDEEAMQKETNI